MVDILSAKLLFISRLEIRIGKVHLFVSDFEKFTHMKEMTMGSTKNFRLVSFVVTALTSS